MNKKDLLKLPICKVNGEKIYYAELDAIYNIEIDNYYKDYPEDKISSEELKELFFETFYSIIYEKLIIQQAKKEGLTVSDEELQKEKENFMQKFKHETEYLIALDDKGLNEDDFIKKLREELLLKKMLKLKVIEPIDFTEEDLKKYYETNKDFLTPKKLYKLSQITLDEEKFTRFSNMILNKLKKGAKFSNLAKQYSIDQYKDDGGNIGYYPIDAFEENIKKELLKLGIGQISNFIKFENKYLLYKLEDVQTNVQKSFDEIKEKLKESLKEQIYMDKFYSYVEKLMENSKIEFFEDNLEKIFKSN